MNTLHTLLAAGLTLRAEGQCLIVTPASALTGALRDLIRQSKAELLDSVRDAEMQTTLLIEVIRRCCDARGDDDANRAALIAECAPLPPAQQAGWREHFDTVADRYEAANRGAIKP